MVERYLAGLNAQPYAPALVVVGTEAHPLGWLVVPQSEAYARTRDVRNALVGAGYLLVDGIDGSLHQVHATADLAYGEWIDEYRERGAGCRRRTRCASG
ncbi:hypothetical protein [Actinocatenispora rupis]|uniref:Uncharacterized protein n=1 Tax=Actinocatenispora rupis TaxID=519421 RepID=A0A8J3NDX6_9ACTN|nr:hypothetical protein [Actinocatenispora rupis]GID15471.1 hypothetical protein Aru02nite_63600 [Actinocatenispora rupis]